MTRRSLSWVLAGAGLVLVVAASAPAFPEDAAEPDAASAAASRQAQAEQQKAAEQTVETILRQQEELLTGQRFSYDPGTRRDPFRSLFEEAATRRKGPRPPGVSGMLVAEIGLSGIVKDPQGGDIALFMGSDNKGYFLRAGDEVYDGTVLAVDPVVGAVTFRQQVDDPRLIKPFRDVVKRLTPVDTEEERAQ